MQLYAHKRAEMGINAYQKDVADKINISPETISRWNAIDGFDEWLNATVIRYSAPISELLEQVAKEQINDFRFWEAISKKHGFIGADGIIPPASPPILSPALTREQAKALLKAELERLVEEDNPKPKAKEENDPSSSG